MSRFVAVLLLVVAVVYTNAFPQLPDHQTECGPNEVFNPCGSECIDTCAKPAPPVCTLRCAIGCQCKDGYVRNAEQKCVLTRDC